MPFVGMADEEVDFWALASDKRRERKIVDICLSRAAAPSPYIYMRERGLFLSAATYCQTDPEILHGHSEI